MSKRPITISVIVLFILLMSAVISFAQGSTPVQIGQNTTGTLSTESPTAQFSLTTNGGETAALQVLALSAGFVPNIRVLNPQDVEVLTVANPGGTATLMGNLTLDEAGVYTIVVGGENGSTGQFVLSLQPGAPLAEPTTLTLNQPLTATVGSGTPTQRYRFNTTSLGAVAVTVQSQTPGSGALVTLYDESAGKAIASSDAGVVGVTYNLPADERLYRVDVRAGAAGDISYTICIGACGSGLPGGTSGGVAASPTPAIAVPTAISQPVETACTVTSSAGGSVNLRSGPGTVYAGLASLPLGQTAQVIGQWTGGGWYQVVYNGQTLWVSGSVVAMTGNCANLPLVPAPANAPMAPTKAPTQASEPPEPIDTPEVEPFPATTPLPLPDLVVSDLAVNQIAPTQLQVTALISNVGETYMSDSFYVSACIDGLCGEQMVSQVIDVGGVAVVTITLSHSANPNNAQTVVVTADSRRDVIETDEDNNTNSLSFTT